ncbi:sigma-70 family RNA polymerase sigma factor [Opitutales bacterium]|nr:sigma-70 family RNA polymerase sigma factor [Opitutales bacterium]MDA8990732.1 sigma-70 family RNA polymerase sigma factor [Opitutales bacterium]
MDASIDKRKLVTNCDIDDLVESAISGNFEAFDSIMVHYRDRLFGVIYNMTLNHSDAADLTQETFVKAFRSISKFKRKSSFFTWIYRIGVNLTLTFLKKKRSKYFFSFDQFFGNTSNSDSQLFLSKENSSVKNTLLNELHEKLNEALSKLSDKHRTIVVLYEIDGISHKEIAEIMNCTEGTVRSRLHYAKLQLQSLLSDYVR